MRYSPLILLPFVPGQAQILSKIMSSQASSAASPSSYTSSSILTDTSISSTGVPSNSNHTTIIVSCILGASLLVSLCIAGAWYFKWRKLSRELQAPGGKFTDASSIASFVAGYSAGGTQTDYKEYTYYMPPAPSITVQDTPSRSATPSLSVSTSHVSLPKSMYEPSPAETYSPAVASSEMYTSHSPLTQSAERAMREDDATKENRCSRLVPVRRVEDAV
ncbi:hypothetical protein D9757_003684 [Collybiopsis confluens]|uniref:Uncharacterized protein n=1 Tax=Collybiopsis confluens TaxID=2823264 RepID=A0A8H5MD02_9AGAR|nr:hypothetical protein D9757_003684 [Collybiopsis confluens]